METQIEVIKTEDYKEWEGDENRLNKDTNRRGNIFELYYVSPIDYERLKTVEEVEEEISGNRDYITDCIEMAEDGHEQAHEILNRIQTEMDRRFKEANWLVVNKDKPSGWVELGRSLPERYIEVDTKKDEGLKILLKKIFGR